MHVVSPLTSLMKDQVAEFSERGLKCAHVGEEQDDPAVKAAQLLKVTGFVASISLVV